MRQFILWGGIALGLVCALLLMPACQPQEAATPALTPTIHLPPEPRAAVPTLVYDGHFPVGYPTPIPIIYNMNDYANRDWANLHPEYGPMGAWANWGWLAVHQGPGQFNWDPIERYLALSKNHQVTLRDGTVISKPIAISIQVFPDAGFDNTPEWIYRHIPGSPTYNGRLVGQIVDPDGPGGCPGLAAPNWGHPTWQQYFDEMVRAFGAKYNNDPRIDSVWIASGMYGETIIEKNFYGCNYNFGVAPFGQWVKYRVMDVYREAFPTKPLYLINTGGGCLRRDTAEIAYSFPVRIGLKHNSLTYDMRDEFSRLGCGKIETMMPYSTSIPIGFEHAFGANPWQVYWATLNGLTHHADLFDFPYHPTEWDILDVLAQLKNLLHGYDHWEFIDRYLGRTLNNTPGVWIVFRDTQWQRYYGLISGGTCIKQERWGWGNEGRDWGFWIHRQDIPGGQALPLCQVPPNREPSECETEFPNIYTRYQELPAALRSNPPAEAKWWNDDRTIKPEIIDKIYGYYSSRRTNEPTDPYIFLKIDNGWPHWGALPQSEPGGTAVYTLTVIYLDQGYDTWTLSYTDYQGNQRDEIVHKTNTQKWQARVWRLTDMYLLRGLLHNSDIILNSNGDGNDYFHMLLLEAEGKAQPAPLPEPTIPAGIPGLRMDDLEERADEIQRRFGWIQEILEMFGDF